MKILVLGDRGFLGQNFIEQTNHDDVVVLPKDIKIRNGELIYRKAFDGSSTEDPNVDLNAFDKATKLFNESNCLINFAADVGGIQYNQANPDKLFRNNLDIGLSTIDLCVKHNIKYLINIGTTCSYPEMVKDVPFKEKDFWNGYPEKTNAPYGIAKKAIIEYGSAVTRKHKDFKVINLILANMYGVHDCFDDDRSHVIPGLIKKMIKAKSVKDLTCEIWGTGEATRDFLHARDAVRAVDMAISNVLTIPNNSIINIGSGQEVSIKELAECIKDITGYHGELVFNPDKPDGQKRRVLDITKAKHLLGYDPEVCLKNGLSHLIQIKIFNDIHNKHIENVRRVCNG